MSVGKAVPGTISVANRSRERLATWTPAGLVVVAALACYLPFTIGTLYHSDSVGFAKAIEHFDMRSRQPQAPGYPLYIMTLRAIKWLTSASDVTCLVTASVFATLIAVVLFHRLVRRWASPLPAALLALLLATSPVVWFNADITMSYPFGLLGGVAVALAACDTIEGSRRARHLLPVLWGLAAGFRQDTGVLLGPVVLYAALREVKRSWRYSVTFVVSWAAAVASWFVPLVKGAGGLASYRQLLAAKAGAGGPRPLALLVRGDWGAFLVRESQTVIVIMAWILVGILGAVALVAVRSLPRVSVEIKRPDPVVLVLWGGAGVLTHSLVGPPGHSGYVLSYLPAVLLLPLAFRGASPSGEVRPAAAWKLPILLAGGVALQCAFFLLLPQGSGKFAGHWRSDTLVRSVLKEPTRSRIASYDAAVRMLVRVIPMRFRPETTLLLVAAGEERPWYPPVRQMQALGRYYLPQWEQRVLDSGSGYQIAEVNGSKFVIRQTRLVEVPHEIEWLVWFSDPAAQPYAFEGRWTREPMEFGIDLLFARVDPLAPETWRWGPFLIESRP